MSDIISYWFNKHNPRERQALEILKTWCANGYSIRHILTEALFKLDDSNSEVSTAALEDLNETLN